MLEMRSECERCGAELPADAPAAFICSLETTFCADCADALDERCPDCGGELVDRPTRVGKTLRQHPVGANPARSGIGR